MLPALKIYENEQELLHDSIEHHNWCIHKESKSLHQIVKIAHGYVYTSNYTCTFEEFCDKFIWANGEPCGKRDWTDYFKLG